MKYPVHYDIDGERTGFAEYYDIVFTDGSAKTITVERHAALPDPGDILIFDYSWESPGCQWYHKGDEIHLHERTQDAPFGRLSSLGNWRAISKYGVLVWSNIEWLLWQGVIVERT